MFRCRIQRDFDNISMEAVLERLLLAREPTEAAPGFGWMSPHQKSKSRSSKKLLVVNRTVMQARVNVTLRVDTDTVLKLSCDSLLCLYISFLC